MEEFALDLRFFDRIGSLVERNGVLLGIPRTVGWPCGRNQTVGRPALVEDQTPEVVSEVDQPDLGGGTRQPDGAHEQAHVLLLVCEDVFHGRADDRLVGVTVRSAGVSPDPAASGDGYGRPSLDRPATLRGFVNDRRYPLRPPVPSCRW